MAGILGLATDDPRVADAFALAKAAGVSVEIIWDTTTEVAHPTPWTSAARAARGAPEMRGVSIRGRRGGHSAVSTASTWTSPGNARAWSCTSATERGVLAHIAGVLAGCGINIANANLHRTAKRGDAYTVLETIAPWMRACASF